MSAAVQRKAACTCCDDDTVTIDCPIDPPGQCPWSMDLTISGTASGGTYKITLNGVQTAAIAYNATFATILNAIRAMGETYYRGAASLSGTQLSNTSTLKKFRITFIRKALNPTTPTASVQSSVTGGATLTLTAPTSPLRQSLAGNGRMGRFKLALSGITMGDFTGLDARGNTTGGIAVSIGSFGTYLGPTSPTARDTTGQGNVMWNLPTADRQQYVTRGVVPAAIYVSAQYGTDYFQPVLRYNPASDTEATLGAITLLHPDARLSDETPGTLAKLPFISTGVGYNSGIRQNYIGEQVAFEDRDHVWPYAIPKANGIEPMMTNVFHQVEVGYPSGNSFGGGSRYLTIYAVATLSYRTSDVYPTFTPSTGSPLYPSREGYTGIAHVRGIIFQGAIDETDGPFPCAKASWTIPNQATAAGVADSTVNAVAMTIASGGTVTVTAEDFPAFGTDMPAEYTLAMQVGEPRNYLAPPVYTDNANYGPPTTDNMETVNVTLKRVCISDYERQSTNEHLENYGFSPVWYGETDDGKYHVALSAYWSSRSDNVYFATLRVERQTPWPIGTGGRSLVFVSPLQPGYDLAPPANTTAAPRYRLASAKVGAHLCVGAGDPPSYLNPTPLDNDGFRFTFPVLTKSAATMNCPSRGPNDSTCGKTFRVAWKDDGSLIQVLAAGDGAPAGTRSVIVTAAPCGCALGAMSNFILCQPLYSNQWTAGFVDGGTSADYVLVTLTATTMVLGGGANGSPALPFTSAPGWQVAIYTKCPENRLYAKKAQLVAPWCPPIAVYDGLPCASFGATCIDCKDTNCADVGDSIRVVIEIPDSDREAWSERHDPEGNGDEPPTLIFDCVRTVKCLWKAAAPAAASAMTTKAVRCEFEKVNTGTTSTPVWQYRISVYRPHETADGAGTADVLVFRAWAVCDPLKKPDVYEDDYATDVGQTLYEDGNADNDGDGNPDGLDNSPLAAYTT